MGRGSVADRRSDGRTLYSQVAAQLEAVALSGPLGEETVLPAEWELVELLGVSRGTVRRAVADLERSGLVWREAGRGTFVNPAARLRRVVFDRLLQVAKPDARFHFDFASFVPDFEESRRCVELIRKMPEYRGARTLVVTADNNLEGFRELALADGKRLVVSTYGLLRGFVLVRGKRIRSEDRALAATLDGMERFGKQLAYAELRAAGPIDLVVSGAAAVSRSGVHFGKGHGFLETAWGLLSEMGLVGQQTPVIVSAHDCQLIDEPVPCAAFDVTVDVIVTPGEVVRCRQLPKPSGLYWDRVPREFADARPYFAELRQQRAPRPGPV
jgi:5-formyltetrahydrofolate cyclo-ligase